MPAPLSLRIKERYMAKRSGGLSQQIAADAVGISVRSAQRIDRGDHQPRDHHGRHWRTRADPLSDVWDSVLVPMLQKAPQLDPQTLLLHLEEIRPGQEWYRRKRTLQRRVEQWRALHGPAQDVMFLQEHRAGVLGISDFTLLKGAPITIGGVVLEHRLFHFRLPFSGWCHVEVIHGGESFVAVEFLVGQPGHILIVALVLLAGWSLLRFSGAVSGPSARPLLWASLAWGVYAAWEALVQLRTPEANIRVDLLLIWPLLAGLTLFALIMGAIGTRR
ncbi:MAG: hypothetical protein QUV07_04680 [Cyanobium sp. CZS 25K]|nr:hypothetical protein [Cyanobium sp. CZS25K]